MDSVLSAWALPASVGGVAVPRVTVVRLVRIAGFRPWKWQPLPGNQVLWKAWKVVQIGVLRDEARAARDRPSRTPPLSHR